MSEVPVADATGMYARLFHRDRLVATVAVEGPAALNRDYEVKGVQYRTIFYVETSEPSGRRGLDVQATVTTDRRATA